MNRNSSHQENNSEYHDTVVDNEEVTPINESDKSNSHSTSNSSNPVKFMSTNDIFNMDGVVRQSLSEAEKSDSSGSSEEAELNLGTQGHDDGNKNPVRVNQRTPDLDKIAKFIKGNRTPGRKSILSKYNSSDLEDTPVNQRRVLRGDNSSFNKISTIRKNLTEDINQTEKANEINIHHEELQSTPKNKEIFLENSSPYQRNNLKVNGHIKKNNNNNSDIGNDVSVNEFDTLPHSLSNALSYGGSPSKASNIENEKYVLKLNGNTKISSNEATQIINNTSVATQNSKGSQANKQNFYEEHLGIDTQPIISLSQEQNETQVDETVTNNIILSPSVDNSIKNNSLLLSHEPVIEVPRTSSPSKLKQICINNESTQEIPNSQKKIDSQNIFEKEKIYLQVSSRPTTTVNSGDNESTLGEDQVFTINSESELTQELPEIDEANITAEHTNIDSNNEIDQNTSKNETGSIKSSIDGSPRNSSNRNNSQRESEGKMERSFQSVISSHFSKAKKGTGVNSQYLDKGKTLSYLSRLIDIGVLSEEKNYLSKNDVFFNNSVWYLFDKNLKFYPGRYIESNGEYSEVEHKSGTITVLTNDLHFLDIRVNDIVECEGQLYQIVGLQCKNTEVDSIRCIRGYDTLHLRKRKINGSLYKKTYIKSLSDICIDLETWVKRPKIILHGSEFSKANAHEDLKKPIRSRKSSNNSSPRKPLDTNVKFESSTPSKLKNNIANLDYYDKESSPVVPINTSFNASVLEVSKDGSSRGFQDCIFALSNLPTYTDELSDTICNFGGDIAEDGFNSLFDFAEPLSFDDTFLRENFDVSLLIVNSKLKWKSQIMGSKKRFACLFANRHLRSLKYLETLALGWPTLHWKFIEELQDSGTGQIEERLWSYLLPSGESLRLYDNSTKSSVIVSNNIHRFYSNFMSGKTLQDQLANRSSILRGFTVLILGTSTLDKFLNFCFCCLGASNIAYVLSDRISKLSTQKKPNSAKRQKTSNIEIIFNALLYILEQPQLSSNTHVLIYVNCITNDNEDHVVDIIRNTASSVPINDGMKLFVESKEWLIQTIIHTNSGFAH
ncbi:chromatin-binding protein RAD9 RNJ42_02750 [Nakaseomyces bracarensis]|uniref:chromatin-binding protein RAD9 n=1 Tax=Nakaseomyces bracarensis TaxID=273131 RepID=UPI0038721B69